MRYFIGTTVRERIRAAGLPGFTFEDPQGFADWRAMCARKAESIAVATGCRCVHALHNQFSACIQKQRECAYSNRFLGTPTFWEFIEQLLAIPRNDGEDPRNPDAEYFAWEQGDIRQRAQAKLCHMTFHGFSCYCNEPEHLCSVSEHPAFFERTR